MKPLELVWYGDFRDDGNGLRTFHGPDKRFTDAELAATFYGHEYTRLIIERDGLYSEGDLRGQGKTLYRFATHPHYDEVLS
jgi:hypothetical protein